MNTRDTLVRAAQPTDDHATTPSAGAGARTIHAALIQTAALVAATLLASGCGNDSNEPASGPTTTADAPTGGPSTVSPVLSSGPSVGPSGSMPAGPTAPVGPTAGVPSSAMPSMTVGPNPTATPSTTASGNTGASAGGAPGAGGSASGPTGAGGAMGEGGAAAGGAPTQGAAGGEGAGGSEPGGGVPENATIVPDPDWACGMAEGIPSPTQGELAFTITLDISAEREVGNTPYGYRRLLDVSGGTITGERLQGSVMTRGLEFELTLENGVVEYQGINILETSAGRIFVRSCGVAPEEGKAARIIPDFEAGTDGANAFLNTGKWVATRELTDGKMILDVYDVSEVTAGEPRVVIEKPEGVKPQPWECNMTTGSQGAEVLTENVTLGSSFSIANAKYGSRNVIPITGGTTSGRVTGAILDGGADYQLNGTLDAWYTLAPDNGEFILVRNCGGANGLIPWFEAAVDGEFDFLNTQAYLSSPPGVGGGGVSITFYERQ